MNAITERRGVKGLLLEVGTAMQRTEVMRKNDAAFSLRGCRYILLKFEMVHISRRTTSCVILTFRRRSTQKPVMTCYKTVTVEFKWSRLLQNKIETYIQDKYRDDAAVR